MGRSKERVVLHLAVTVVICREIVYCELDGKEYVISVPRRDSDVRHVQLKIATSTIERASAIGVQIMGSITSGAEPYKECYWWPHFEDLLQSARDVERTFDYRAPVGDRGRIGVTMQDAPPPARAMRGITL